MSSFVPIQDVIGQAPTRGTPPALDKNFIMELIITLDDREDISQVVPVPRTSSWRVRREDFGALAYQPAANGLVRFDDEPALQTFVGSNQIAQFVEGQSVANSLRAPVKLFLDITKICNEECKHCLSSSGLSRETLPVATLRSLVDQAYDLGIFQIKLGGGEPILHPRFFEIVNYINQRGLAVSISSNGAAMTPQRVELLRETGVKVSISIDGDEEMHNTVRGSGSYQRTLEGINRLVVAGVRPGIRMTLFNHPELNNLASVKDVVELGNRLELAVKLRRAKPSGRAQANSLALAFPTQDYWELLDWVNAAKAQGADVDIEDLMCLTGDGEDKLFPTQFDCAAGTRSIHVDVYGAVSPCVFLGPSHTSGNIFAEPLATIWYAGHGFRQARDYTTQANSDCHSCERNKLCSGECRALVFEAQRILGQPLDGGGKDPCCPKEKRTYVLEPAKSGKYTPIRQ